MDVGHQLRISICMLRDIVVFVLGFKEYDLARAVIVTLELSEEKSARCASHLESQTDREKNFFFATLNICCQF